MVEADAPGFEVGRIEPKMGIKGSTTGEIFFNDCRIPADNLLGEEGEGFRIAMRILDRSRPGIGAQGLGLAQGATDYALEYAKSRETMGKPIAQHQLIAAMLADMETKCEAARGLLYKCGQLIDEGADGAELTKISAMAKLYCTDVAMEVTTDAVQILGGYGYIQEYPVERMMRDAKITQIYEGTNQIQRLVIAREMVKELRGSLLVRRPLAREAPPDAFGRTAREYELGRPEWPAELLDRVVAELGLTDEAAVLDLGAGTGKLTRALVPRFARVVAVEPDDAMRAVLEEVVPGAEALAGQRARRSRSATTRSTRSSRPRRFTGSPRESRRVRSRACCGRAGRLAIFWNIPIEYAEVGDEAEAVIEEAFERGGVPGLPRVLSGEWKRPVEDGLRGAARGRGRARDPRHRDEWIANLLSVSSIASPARGGPGRVREPPARARPADREVSRRIRTVAYWTRRV